MGRPSIAVDILGGDNSPDAELAGVEAALEAYDLHLLLVGPEELIESRLNSRKGNDFRGSYEIIHAEDKIGMCENPLSAVRQKKNSSLMVAVDSVSEGRAAGLVSAGNTGAVTVATKIKWGVREGVERPAIATLFPTRSDDYTIIIDVGANSDCTPVQLVQFGLMGAVYAEIVLDKQSPSIALLNLGEEDVKGNQLTREAYKLFTGQPLNFAGNIEGNSITDGAVDVIVCDGFVGNVVLKLSEGLSKYLRDFLKQGIYSSLRTKLGGLLLKPVFNDFEQMIDASEIGGAPLLGLNYSCIIAHGDSSPKAIKNAIRVASLCIDKDYNAKIAEQMHKLSFPEEE